MNMITNGEISIGVIDMKPARKRPSLCVIQGNVITRYASFTSESAADEFMEILANLTGAEEHEKS